MVSEDLGDGPRSVVDPRLKQQGELAVSVAQSPPCDVSCQLAGRDYSGLVRGTLNRDDLTDTCPTCPQCLGGRVGSRVTPDVVESSPPPSTQSDPRLRESESKSGVLVQCAGRPPSPHTSPQPSPTVEVRNQRSWVSWIVSRGPIRGHAHVTCLSDVSALSLSSVRGSGRGVNC